MMMGLTYSICSHYISSWLGYSCCRTEPQVFDERIEVFVAVQQSQSALDAPRRNDGVDRLAHRDTVRSHGAKVLRCLNGDVSAGQLDDDERSQKLPGLIEVPVVDKALQHLGQGQIPDRNRLRP